MPRGRRPASDKPFDQQITEIDAEIETLKSKIADAKTKRKTLVEKKKDADVAALVAAVKESGKTTEEVIALLKKTNGKS